MAQETYIPRLYAIFFLYVEPFSALVGAYYAYFVPAVYLSLTSFPTQTLTPTTTTNSSKPLDLATTTALAQLANLYLFFALNEALVLRSTTNLTVWRTLLFGLLVADVGHLWSVSGFGSGVYTNPWQWNEMMWGNVGFVYMGAAMRICFLSGVGLATKKKKG